MTKTKTKRSKPWKCGGRWAVTEEFRKLLMKKEGRKVDFERGNARIYAGRAEGVWRMPRHSLHSKDNGQRKVGEDNAGLSRVNGGNMNDQTDAGGLWHREIMGNNNASPKDDQTARRDHSLTH